MHGKIAWLKILPWSECFSLEKEGLPRGLGKESLLLKAATSNMENSYLQRQSNLHDHIQGAPGLLTLKASHQSPLLLHVQVNPLSSWSKCSAAAAPTFSFIVQVLHLTTKEPLQPQPKAMTPPHAQRSLHQSSLVFVPGTPFSWDIKRNWRGRPQPCISQRYYINNAPGASAAAAAPPFIHCPSPSPSQPNEIPSRTAPLTPTLGLIRVLFAVYLKAMAQAGTTLRSREEPLSADLCSVTEWLP
nr:hypothetical protein Iba_chr07aCG16130 [Ipomoea batatas]